MKKILNDININKNDKKYLISLLVFALLLTYVMIKFHQSRGAFNSDIYVYLASALDFASLNNNHISSLYAMFCSPVISYLTSIFFRLGYVDINSIFIVTGFFGIIGIFGMYVLLKIRFSPILSFAGAILYSSFSLVLFYYANGMLDTSAVAILIWVLIFAVAAVNKNPKYYLIVSFLFVISIFVRYTNFISISLIALLILKNHDLLSLIENLITDRQLFKNRVNGFLRSNEFKWMAISSVIGILLIGYVCYILLSYGSQLAYLNVASDSMSHFSANTLDNNYVTDNLFYLKNFLSLLFSNKIFSIKMIEKFTNPSWISYLLMSILGLGLIFNLKDLIPKFKEMPLENSYNLFFLLVILLSISIIGFYMNYIISLVSLWLFFVTLMTLLKKMDFNQENVIVFILCLALFTVYMVIFSSLNIKCVRYILPTFPAFVFFIIYSIENIMNFIDNLELESKLNIKFSFSNILLILFILLLLFNAFNFSSTVEIDKAGLAIDDVANYLINYDKDYQSKEIGIESGVRYYEWYFQKDIKLYDNSSLKNAKFDYLISSEINDPNYHEIYRSNGLAIYERNF